MTNPRVELPAALAAAIREEARRAIPRECCGLLEGVRGADSFTIHALHPARNLAGDPDRFEIDPQDHIAAARTAREKGTRIVGCYHSHPTGPPQLSARDGGGEEDFIWLIAATDGGSAKLAAWLYHPGRFTPLDLALGTDSVTSSLNERS